MPFHCFTEGEGGEKGTSLLKGMVDNPCVIPTHWFAMRKHFPCKISAGKVRIAASIVVVICLFGALDFCVYAPKVRPIKCLFRIFIEGNVDISNNQSTKLLVVESPTWHDPWANDGRYIGPGWYMCLKIENCCLKIFVEIRVGEKVHWNAWNVV